MMHHLPRRCCSVTEAYQSIERLPVSCMPDSKMAIRCRHLTGRLAKFACRSTAGPHVTGREYSSPPREFPASFTNLDGTRGVLRVGGSEIIPFLQGLLTNDVHPLQNPKARPIYAALLNAQGRQLHDMFLFRTEGEQPVILMDVDLEFLQDLKKKLIMYKLRSDVDIADVTDEFSVWTRFGKGRMATEEWTADPRMEELGQRTIRGRLDKPSAPEGEPETTPLEYRRWRMAQGVAEGDTEMPSGKAMPLEYNLDRLNGISYTKGCYVGQELVARTHNRGVVRKRLMPVTISGRTPEAGSPVAPTGGGAPIGDIRAAEEGGGLAHLRLKQGLEALRGDLQLIAGDAVTHIRHTDSSSCFTVEPRPKYLRHSGAKLRGSLNASASTTQSNDN